MSKQEFPIKGRIEIRVTDYAGRGDLVVERTDEKLFKVWAEITDFGENSWDMGGTHNTLESAMSEVADIIKCNAENFFYQD